MIRKRLNSEPEPNIINSRSMLGVKEKKSKDNDWVSTFNIGSVMMIQPKKSMDAS